MSEEIIYCSECGAANKASAVVCVECEKKIRLKHSPAIRFMRERICDKIKGDLEDKGIEILKNYILSHLYGVVMTVFLVTTGVAFALPKGTVYTPDTKVPSLPAIQSDIEEELPIPNTPQAVVEEYAKEETSSDTPRVYEEKAITEESQVDSPQPKITETVIEDADKNAIWAITRDYQRRADYLLAGYGSDTGVDITSYYAQSVQGFPYSGAHDMMSKGVRAAGEGKQVTGFGTRGIRKFLTNDSLTSPLAITLRDNGYEVCEGEFLGGLNLTDTPVDTSKIEECDIVLRYRVVLVKLSGQWYVAEDVLL